MKKNSPEYKRREFLKELYKKYGDLPRHIFDEIVKYKTDEKNKPKKLVLNKDCIGSVLWINDRINKSKKEIELIDSMHKHINSKDYLSFFEYEKTRVLHQGIYNLTQEKRRLIACYKYGLKF